MLPKLCLPLIPNLSAAYHCSTTAILLTTALLTTYSSSPCCLPLLRSPQLCSPKFCLPLLTSDAHQFFILPSLLTTTSLTAVLLTTALLTTSSSYPCCLPLLRSPQFCSRQFCFPAYHRFFLSLLPQFCLPLLPRIPAVYNCSAHRSSAHHSSAYQLIYDSSYYPCYHSSAYHSFLISLLLTAAPSPSSAHHGSSYHFFILSLLLTTAPLTAVLLTTVLFPCLPLILPIPVTTVLLTTYSSYPCCLPLLCSPQFCLPAYL